MREGKWTKQDYGGDVVAQINRINAQQAEEESRNPLAGYSTLQLKAELARRRRQPKWSRLGIGL